MDGLVSIAAPRSARRQRSSESGHFDPNRFHFPSPFFGKGTTARQHSSYHIISYPIISYHIISYHHFPSPFFGKGTSIDALEQQILSDCCHVIRRLPSLALPSLFSLLPFISDVSTLPTPTRSILMITNQKITKITRMITQINNINQ